MIDFDQVYDRTGTAEKYDLREHIFGREDVTPLWVADTDFPAPSCVTHALSDRVNHPLYGYQVPRPEATLTAIVWWLKHKHGLELNQEEILLSPSVVTSMGVVIDALTEPGDTVGIFTPVYPPFFEMIRANNRVCAPLPLTYNNHRYTMDLEALEKNISGMKLFLLCSPHNPSGRVWSEKELQQLFDLCRSHDVLILSDEIHSDIIMPGHKHTNVLRLPGVQQHVVVAHSIAKTFNCAGLRASFMVVPNDSLRRKIYRSQKKTHTEEVNIFGKIALASVLSDEGCAYQKQLIDYVSQNHQLVKDKFSEAFAEVFVMPAESTFLSWVDFSGLGLSHQALKSLFINQARVGLSEGQFFGPTGAGFQRINVGIQRSILCDALDRMIATLKEAL